MAAEVSGWRRVMTGLRILLAAWLGVPVAAMLGVAMIAVIILFAEEHRWVRPLAAWLVGGSFVLALLTAAVGLGYCCRVPSETGARPPLLFAIGLAVLSGALLLAWQFIDPLLFSLSRPPNWRAINAVRLAVHGVCAGSLIAACLAWLLFLRAITLALGDQAMSRGLRIYAIAFAAWAGIAIASTALWKIQPLENAVVTAIAGVSLILGFGHYVWLAGLLGAVAEKIEAVLRDSQTESAQKLT